MKQDTGALDNAVSGLVELHQRLLGCFTSPTGIAPPRRPKWLEPTKADCDAALYGMVELERAKAEIDRLSKIACSSMLNGLLTEEETEAMIKFVRELRAETGPTDTPEQPREDRR
jgi:hypothetical protein